VSELKAEYKGKIDFTITPAQTKAGQAAAEKYDFGTQKHGLVGFDADGTLKITMPGHNHSKQDIVAKLQELLR